MRLRTKGIRISIFSLSLILGLTLIYWGFYPNISRCFLIDASGMEKIETKVYVSPDTPIPTRNLLKEIIARSHLRIEDFWGARVGSPTIIYCHNIEDFEHYGSGSPGVAYLNPFNSFVVIGPEGLRTDVVSHEFCHVELFERLGWYNSKYQKPAWFDEGLALMVDYRYSSREAHTRYFGFLVDWDKKISKGTPAIDLQELDNISDFADREHHQKIFAYITAGMEVSRWLDLVGPEGLHELVRDLKAGESFPNSYTEVESIYRQEKKRLTWKK